MRFDTPTLRYSSSSEKNAVGDIAFFGGGRRRSASGGQRRPHAAESVAASEKTPHGHGQRGQHGQPHAQQQQSFAAGHLVQWIVYIRNGWLPACAAFAAHAATLASFTRCARGIVYRRRVHAEPLGQRSRRRRAAHKR